MAIGAGIGGQLGIAAESAYGTFVAPTKFLEFTSEELVATKVTAQSAGVAAGRLLPLAARRVVTTRAAGGSVAMEVTRTRMGLLLQSLMGTTVTPVQQAATTAYLQTHTLADTAGKSLSVQKGVPRTDGVVADYSFLGCKVVSAEFSCEVGGLLTSTFEFDAKTVSETETLASPSYPVDTPFHGGELDVKTGAFGSETSLDGVRSISVTIQRPQNVERYYAGQAGLKKEPITNDAVAITGNLTADFTAATLADLFASDGSTSLALVWTGPIIASTYPYLFRINLPAIKIDGTPPAISGNEVITTEFSFTGLYDGTNFPAILYQSTDTTL